MATWTINAVYDEDAHVWCTWEGDVPGLVTSGRTVEELRDRAAAVLPELLELNAHEIDPERLAPPHQLRLIAHYESVTAVAA